MAYETGSSTGVVDLLEKLATFLVANGWTKNLLAVDNTTYHTWTGLNGTGKRLHVQKTAADATVMYFNLRAVTRGIIFGEHHGDSGSKYASTWYFSEITGIGLNGSTGYDVGQPWDTQPGYQNNGSVLSRGCCINAVDGTIPNYWFFSSANNDCVIVMVEYTGGKFQYFMFGLIHKIGTWTGGQFCLATCNSYWPYLIRASTWSGQVKGIGKLGYMAIPSSDTNPASAIYANIDSSANWKENGESNGYAQFDGLIANLAFADHYGDNFMLGLIMNSPNVFNAVAPMFKVHGRIKRTGTNNWSMAGWIENLRQLRIDNYANAEEVVLGSDTWMVFPAHCRTEDELSGYGIAVKKVV